MFIYVWGYRKWSLIFSLMLLLLFTLFEFVRLRKCSSKHRFCFWMKSQFVFDDCNSLIENKSLSFFIFLIFGKKDMIWGLWVIDWLVYKSIGHTQVIFYMTSTNHLWPIRCILVDQESMHTPLESIWNIFLTKMKNQNIRNL